MFNKYIRKQHFNKLYEIEIFLSVCPKVTRRFLFTSNTARCSHLFYFLNFKANIQTNFYQIVGS